MTDKFKDYQYAGIKYKVFDMETTKQIKSSYPKLFESEEWNVALRGVNKVNVIKYIVLLYDRNSPLLASEPNILKRKKKAGEVADFEPNDEYKDIINGKNKKVNAMIVRYIIGQKSLEFAQYLNLCETYFQHVLLSMSAKDSIAIAEPTEMVKILQATNKLNREIKELIKDIDESYNDLFDSDKSLKNEVLHTVDVELVKSPLGFPELAGNGELEDLL